MTASIELSPLGTARSALPGNDQATGALRQEAAMLAWLGQLREPLETEYNLESEVSAIAWELARWQPGLNLREHQALLLLILLALVQVRRGSTRVAVRGPKGSELRIDFARLLLSKVSSGDESLQLDPSEAASLLGKLTDSGLRQHACWQRWRLQAACRRGRSLVSPEDALPRRPVRGGNSPQA